MKVAVIQLASGPNIQENLFRTGEFIRAAAAEGAELVATPEITDQVISNRADKIDEALTESEHPGVKFFAELAKELGIHILIGSMCIKVADKKIANRSFLFDKDGTLVVTYDKMHLFDVDLPSGESYRESNLFVPGSALIIGDLGSVKVGMSICYDVRFPHIFRDMARAGAKILSIPAAFTVLSGQAHWHVLLRARAIECGAFVIAPAQVGDHMGARKTYGHSLIIGPWGEIIAEHTEDTAGFIIADLDLEQVAKARQSIPSLLHDREYVDIS